MTRHVKQDLSKSTSESNVLKSLFLENIKYDGTLAMKEELRVKRAIESNQNILSVIF